MNNFEASAQAERLIEWFKDKELPTTPCEYRPAHTITDVQKFVQTQVDLLRKGKVLNMSWKAAYFRLYNLKKFMQK